MDVPPALGSMIDLADLPEPYPCGLGSPSFERDFVHGRSHQMDAASVLRARFSNAKDRELELDRIRVPDAEPRCTLLSRVHSSDRREPALPWSMALLNAS